GGPDGSRQIESRVADRSEMGCHVLPFDSLRSLTRSIRNAHSGCPERSRRAGHSTRPKCVAEGHERAHREAGESNGGGGGTRTPKGRSLHSLLRGRCPLIARAEMVFPGSGSSLALAAPDCVASTSPRPYPCGSETQRQSGIGVDRVK